MDCCAVINFAYRQIMSNTTTILAKEFASLKNELIAKYDELGMRASGHWADSLSIAIEGNNADAFACRIWRTA